MPISFRSKTIDSLFNLIFCLRSSQHYVSECGASNVAIAHAMKQLRRRKKKQKQNHTLLIVFGVGVGVGEKILFQFPMLSDFLRYKCRFHHVCRTFDTYNIYCMKYYNKNLTCTTNFVL